MKKLLVALLLLIPSTVNAQSALSYGTRGDSINASASCGTGTSYAVPTASSTGVTWTVTLSAAPATAISIVIEGSLNNTNWYTLDSSSALSGEIRSFATTALFIRARCVSKTDGGNLTVSIVLNRGSIAFINTSLVGLLAGNNIWTGINTFTNTVNFDGSVDFDGAVTFDGSVTYTLPINAPVGCASPGYTFTGDSNTGVCNEAGLDTVGIVTGGTKRTEWTTTAQLFYGAVNIGNGSGDSPEIVYAETSFNSPLFTNSGANQTVGPSSNHDLILRANNINSWSVDNVANSFLALGAFNIGDGAGNSPVTIFTETSFSGPAFTHTAAMSVGPTAGELTLRAGGGNAWQINSGTLALLALGAYSIGNGVGDSPTNIYFETALIGPGTVADSGDIRLANNKSIFWRNAANSANLGWTLDASNTLVTATDVQTTAGGFFASADIQTSGGNVLTSAGGGFIFTGRSRFTSSGDGLILARNDAGTGFTRFIFGTNDTSGISLVKSSTEMQAKLGDSSGFINFNALTLQTQVTTVASLPTCDAGAKAKRYFVSDATATTFASTVAGGGANNVPVVCDGTNWIIG